MLIYENFVYFMLYVGISVNIITFCGILVMLFHDEPPSGYRDTMSHDDIMSFLKTAFVVLILSSILIAWTSSTIYFENYVL